MSFEIALSGIQAINEQLNATSNNIANAGTYGYKSGRANFAAMYAGSQATGTEIGSLTQNMALNGGVLSTGRGLDAAISGSGYFVARDGTGQTTFSRVGIFSTASDGTLVDSAGRDVQGYAAIAGSSALGPMGKLVILTGQIPAVASRQLDYVANLSTDWTVPSAATFDPDNNQSYSMSKLSVLYDSLGAEHTLTQYFVKSATANTVDVHYSFDDGAPLAVTSTLSFDSGGQLTAPAAPVALALAPVNGAAGIAIDLDYTGTTQFAGDAVTSTNSADGYASGTYTGVALGADGALVAQYSNGQKQTVGTIALANFANADGMTAISDTSWVASSTSGTANYSTPGSGLAGSLATSSLEQSNVDITSELVGLMTSQRNYQANSKVISTESAMMQSLMQAL